MKKVLFGILALSMAAFAANPGVPGTVPDTEVASVPVEVRAEIITAPTGLVITDEAGTVLDQLLLDHGRMIKGAATSDSVVEKIFKVQRYIAGTAAPIGAGTLNVQLDSADAILGLDGDLTGTTLKSVLSLGNSNGASFVSTTEYNQTLVAADTQSLGRVTSRISQTELAAAPLGIFHNARANSLAVVYTPN
ncbi:MAG: hypothetical protein ACRC6Z_03370 [Cetobacterium sp.]